MTAQAAAALLLPRHVKEEDSDEFTLCLLLELD